MTKLSQFIVRMSLLFISSFCFGQGYVPVRIEDPSGTHCIDATTEEISMHVRRIFTERTGGLFTEDNRAGVMTKARLIGKGDGKDAEVQIPSVDLVSVKDEPKGRVSLALEYMIASYLPLKQDKIITTDIMLNFSMAKTQERNSFGKVLDLAGKIITQVSIPANPYADTASKFLKFANGVIDENVNQKMNVPFAALDLAFRKGFESDIKKCRSAGKERTGAIAVILSKGAPNSDLIPVTDTEKYYCFRYSNTSTYELTAAKKTGLECPTDDAAYHGVNNDYIMILLSSNISSSVIRPGILESLAKQYKEESRKRCNNFGLSATDCGVKE